MNRRIVLTAMGSLGDVHPYLAIALELQARGHSAVVATSACYRTKVESLGLEFQTLSPDSTFVTDPDLARRFMDYRWGTVRVIREVVLPVIRQSYADTLAAVGRHADLLVCHPLTFATRLVAEKLGIPWVSTHVTPLGLFSPHDLPALPVLPDLTQRLRWLGPHIWGPLGELMTHATRPWARPIDQLRSEIGLPPCPDNPLVDGHSPTLVLALYAECLAPRQVDCPPQVVYTGFPTFDRDPARAMSEELSRFLDDGPPPIVFTLGVTAAMVGGHFFRASRSAAEKLGRRAVLIIGPTQIDDFSPFSDQHFTCSYVPFSKLFSRSCLIVHAGGIGTTGLVMRSGRPSLVVPHAHDQPDNAARLTRLGIARTIAPRRYTVDRSAKELERLLNQPAYAERAQAIGESLGNDDGAGRAADALEALL